MQKSCSIQLEDHFPGVQELSHSRTHSAKPFIPTFEDKTWTSILYIERGNFQIRYETGEVLRAKGGTFYYHPPLSLKYQTYDKMITPYSMYHLAVDLSLPETILFHPDTVKEHFLAHLSAKPFVRIAPPLLVASFKTLFEEYAAKQPGYLLQIENSIRQILISAMRSGVIAAQHSVTAKKIIEKIDIFLAANKDFMGPVEQLFERMGVSRSRGYDIFHQNFGINPKEYILRRKIVFAKEMLLEERAISSIAYDLGFSSSQSFATTFKKLTCSTPSNYRKKRLQ